VVGRSASLGGCGGRIDRYTHALRGSEADTAAKVQAFLDRSVG
jgi:hypothetical protein